MEEDHGIPSLLESQPVLTGPQPGERLHDSRRKTRVSRSARSADENLPSRRPHLRNVGEELVIPVKICHERILLFQGRKGEGPVAELPGSLPPRHGLTLSVMFEAGFLHTRLPKLKNRTSSPSSDA